jgi:hypothetical protein
VNGEPAAKLAPGELPQHGAEERGLAAIAEVEQAQQHNDRGICHPDQ